MQTEFLIQIKDLKASIDNKEILKGLNLEVKPGEIHAIMGPNGSGKSTLANVLTGREIATVTSGTVIFRGKESLLEMSPDGACPRRGIFLSFQYPIEISPVSAWSIS